MTAARLILESLLAWGIVAMGVGLVFGRFCSLGSAKEVPVQPTPHRNRMARYFAEQEREHSW
ncbi:MAG: hypothetical protein ACTHLZ_09780 [Tepidisphaeraceae bacterium]